MEFADKEMNTQILWILFWKKIKFVFFYDNSEDQTASFTIATENGKIKIHLYWFNFLLTQRENQQVRWSEDVLEYEMKQCIFKLITITWAIII